jgi:bla regulator protein BlaR1
METSFLIQWFSDHHIKAICWTLIHSLWIGTIGALLAGLLISFTPRSGARIRYNGLCGILVLFVIAIGLTYYFQVRGTNDVAPMFNTANVNFKDTDVVKINEMRDLPPQGIVSQAVEFLDRNMNIIFLTWLFIFILKSLKLMTGLIYIQQLRSYKTRDVAEELKHKIEMFGNQIGIRQTVRLVQSELIKVPVVVGWLKPVILLPMGIILQLRADQLESILWHELAHIRRRDYLVNILQGLVEIVFFFNPGLHWLSSLIRAEREACCDDIVLSYTNSKVNYLEALLVFSYDEKRSVPLAMNLGSGNQLRDRLRRMVHQENKRLGVVEKIGLMAGLALLLTLASLPNGSPVIASSVQRLPANQLLNDSTLRAREKPAFFPADTAVHFSDTSYRQAGTNRIINEIRSEDKNGKKYHLVVAGNKLLAMHINNEKVTNNDLPKYEYMIGLFREQEKAYAGILEAKFKAGNESGKQRFIDSLQGGH